MVADVEQEAVHGPDCACCCVVEKWETVTRYDGWVRRMFPLSPKMRESFASISSGRTTITTISIRVAVVRVGVDGIMEAVVKTGK